MQWNYLYVRRKRIHYEHPSNKGINRTSPVWIKSNELNARALVVNHFHKDCLADLKLFHELEIPSYGFQLTSKLAKPDSIYSPTIPFVDFQKVPFSNT
jgi:metallo-beta-lactamase class B